MEMMGRGVACQQPRPELLGIAPEGRVTYSAAITSRTSEEKAFLDPNHSHFILVKGSQWGDETATMYGIAKKLAQHIPVVSVLINGGDLAKQEVLQSIRLGWPLVVITGSGRLADEIAAHWHEQRPSSSAPQRAIHRADPPSPPVTDPDLTEILNTGEIYLFSHEDTAEHLRALLKRLFLLKKKSCEEQ